MMRSASRERLAEESPRWSPLHTTLSPGGSPTLSPNVTPGPERRTKVSLTPHQSSGCLPSPRCLPTTDRSRPP
jgi:hypothetical protein